MTWLFTSAFAGLRGRSRKLALTYDDGPNDPHTGRLLDVLATHDVAATFFVIGRYVERRPDIVANLAKHGHVVANHTYDHPPLALCRAREVRAQLQRCERSLEEALGRRSSLFRPPFGFFRPSAIRIARELQLDPVLWSVAGHDWTGCSADKIVQRVVGGIRGGDVILLHDGGHKAFGTDRSATVAATGTLISRCKAEGYEFVTVEQMMALRVGEPTAQMATG
jgi:peptidoglycan/xylan/chitin deacetylase (PgdA/CDA1 family)